MFEEFPETIFDAPPTAPVARKPSDIGVVCERCQTPYRVQRLRGERRLCASCRGAVGIANGLAPFTPESTSADRVRANGLINKRIKLGKIDRPGQCQHCAKPSKTDGHHPDYSKPELIVFLCRSCHMKAHRDKAFEAEVAAKASSTGAVDHRASHRASASESEAVA